jgi:hypothetical protein
MLLLIIVAVPEFEMPPARKPPKFSLTIERNTVSAPRLAMPPPGKPPWLRLAELKFEIDWKKLVVQGAQVSSGVVVSQVTAALADQSLQAMDKFSQEGAKQGEYGVPRPLLLLGRIEQNREDRRPG